MIHFTSDMHFGHQRIIELSGRPFSSVEHMNECIVENWNYVVSDDDVVFILGDACMGKIVESLAIIPLLNGHKFLVPGNHDRVHESYDKRPEKRERWNNAYIDAGFVIMPNEIELEIEGIPVKASHFPFSGDHTEEERFTEFRPVDDGRWLLHGHVHDAWKIKRDQRMINVGTDVWGFHPVSSVMLANLMRESNND